jgi:hypothetical protein
MNDTACRADRSACSISSARRSGVASGLASNRPL